jgi:hypothetical protein
MTQELNAVAPLPAQALSYAAPSGRPGVRIIAATAVLFGGLTLIVIGGCFLIGVMLLTTNSFGNWPAGGPPPLSLRATILLVLLYVSAFACFGGACWMIVSGVRDLYAAAKNP